MAMACTEEDLSVCEKGIKLQYRYVLNSENTNLFGSEVGRVEAYVFDGNGLYVNTYAEQGAHLTNDYVMYLPLPAGYYSVVAWAYEEDGSSYDHGTQFDPETRTFGQDLQPGVTSLEDFRLMLLHNEAASPEVRAVELDEEPRFLVSERPEALLYGLAMELTSQVNPPVHRADMTKNTSRINVIIEGLEAFGSDLPSDFPLVYLTARDGLYDYRNSIPDDARRLAYAPYVRNKVSVDRLETETTVMRLMTAANAAGPTTLTVVDIDTGMVFYETDVVEALMNLKDGSGNFPYKTQQDLDREDEFTFLIDISADTGVEVWINGWEVKQITPEL